MVEPGSPASKLEIRPGWKLLEANSQPLWDILQYMFLTYEDDVTLLFLNSDGAEHRVRVIKEEGEPLGLEFADRVFDGVRKCANKCIFCFVDQMPPGLRSTLYVKDEDYRLSFLEGTYVTMSRFTDRDLESILNYSLSPIYVSVHATNETARRRLLGIKKSRPILATLNALAQHGIQFHTQVVLCPGINDDQILEKTISDLAALGGSVLSLSVVPVGLTSHREGLTAVSPITSDNAARSIGIIDKYRAIALTAGRENSLVYAADELFLKAGIEIPAAGYYDDYPQIENGVGSIRSFLDSPIPATLAQKAQNLIPSVHKKVGIVTGTGFFPYLDSYLDRVLGRHARSSAVIIPVTNGLFGPFVDVAGLLSFRDIEGTVKSARETGLIGPADRVLVPDIVLARGTGLFLDGVEAEEACSSGRLPGLDFICFDDPPGLVARIVEILSIENENSAPKRNASRRNAGRRCSNEH